jgi:hypothetical protein
VLPSLLREKEQSVKVRCVGQIAVLVSIIIFSVAYADIEFVGVLYAGATLTQIDSVGMTPPYNVFFTPDWGSPPPTDTHVFTGVAAWPESVRVHGTINGFPFVLSIAEPVDHREYSDFGMSIRVMFYGDYGIEESKPLAERPSRLTISPSVVTGQMTIRLQPVGTSRPVVQIHDAVGNVIRSLDFTAEAEGAVTATWNREDDHGRLVPEGVYFCRYAAADVIAVRKVLVAH